VKVPSPIDPRPALRGLVAVCLMSALAAGGLAAPFSASAVEIPATAPAVASVDASAAASGTIGTAETTSSLAATLPAVPEPVVKAKKLTVRQTIVAIGRAAGLSKAEVSALLWIAKRESNYHPTSVSSGGCYGLFQLSRGMAHGHPWSDPEWNTKRAIRYMKGRYHGVLKAKAFWTSHHWY
jgi:hypothetical protein